MGIGRFPRLDRIREQAPHPQTVAQIKFHTYEILNSNFHFHTQYTLTSSNNYTRERKTTCPKIATNSANRKAGERTTDYSPVFLKIIRGKHIELTISYHLILRIYWMQFTKKFKIEDTEAHMVFISLLIIQFKNVTFVGTVAEIESNHTNISYTVRDDSGSIEVVQWIENEWENGHLVKTQQTGFLRLGLQSSFKHELVQQHC
ncbi:Replication A 32 kDa subunit-like protein [Daphnia magna]|uniref:Replication A 32 kDa subunit-like protein n=1 Tax=Daphnia magna TaxID=35525 RepID=A0A164NUY5_9CRUS|nr:Replication A 32 kDa subunit-like protein [Daphnia magna]